MAELPFAGLRVLDVATVIAAPAAAMMLGHYGADVIKVEHPDGDMLRILSEIPGTPDADSDWFWQLDGRNKRGMTLNLGEPEGVAILHELVRRADVYITNQPFDQRQRFSLTWETLRELNPRLIYASLSAYGEHGEERERRGFDQLAYWARSGLMELMREPGTVPRQGLPGMGDHPTGVALYAGIVTALLNRERSGEGGLVDTSLLANGLWSAAGIAQGVVAGGDMPRYRAVNEVPALSMRVYRCADGRFLQFNMVRTEEGLSLALAAMDATHLLADERFQRAELWWENREALGDALAAIIAEHQSDFWMDRFAEFGVPVNRVAVVEEVLDDPQLRANRMVIDAPEAMGTGALIRPPFNVSSVAEAVVQRAPAVGEHTDEILAELDRDPEEIQRLRAAGVI